MAKKRSAKQRAAERGARKTAQKGASKKSRSKTSKKKAARKSITKAAVLAHLEREQDPREIAHWEAHREDSGGLDSYGIGLTKLRKYAKTLGRDARLAAQLWRTRIYEAKVIALLIDDPKTLTEEQAEVQVEQLQGGYLAHVFSSCDATLAKAPFAVELLERWVCSRDPVRRRCGYGLLYEVSKWRKKSAPEEAMFLEHIERIDRLQAKQPLQVRMAMGGALMGIGTRSVRLHKAALRAAKRMGPIDFDPDGRCDPFDPAKNLQHKVIRDRLGI
jgi:3-methyladenine DNA glycosylase AlkD